MAGVKAILVLPTFESLKTSLGLKNTSLTQLLAMIISKTFSLDDILEWYGRSNIHKDAQAILEAHN